MSPIWLITRITGSRSTNRSGCTRPAAFPTRGYRAEGHSGAQESRDGDSCGNVLKHATDLANSYPTALPDRLIASAYRLEMLEISYR
jgi:hypothetical protein